MFVCFYFLVDFKREGAEMGYFILMLFLANWSIMSLGQLFALASPNEESASGLAGLSVILSVILMGFLIMYEAMPRCVTHTGLPVEGLFGRSGGTRHSHSSFSSAIFAGRTG
jgi:ABC-type multidrug transport system permease subunit